MKNITIVLISICALVFFSAKSPETTDQDLSLDGAWELTGFYSYDQENNISDTVLPTDGYRQIKMYQAGKVMWTRFVPKDSVEWFGYGSYTNSPNELVETLEYGSNSMMKIIDTLRVFKFELILEKERFTQITVDENGHRVFSENYKRLN